MAAQAPGLPPAPAAATAETAHGRGLGTAGPRGRLAAASTQPTAPACSRDIAGLYSRVSHSLGHPPQSPPPASESDGQPQCVTLHEQGESQLPHSTSSHQHPPFSITPASKHEKVKVGGKPPTKHQDAPSTNTSLSPSRRCPLALAAFQEPSGACYCLSSGSQGQALLGALWFSFNNNSSPSDWGENPQKVGDKGNP